MKQNDFIKNKNIIYSILENSYDGIYITDIDSTTLYVNKAYEKLSGHSRHEYLGKTMYELIESGIMKTHITQDVIAKRKPITVNEELISGKKVLITGSPVFDDNDNIIAVVTNIRDITEIIALEKKERLSDEIISLYKSKYFNPALLNDIVCESPSSFSVFNCASKVSATDSTILLTGETGVGKEVVAKYIHHNSPRKNNNYIKVNCGAIPEHLLESELFGYVGGAFTGADPKGKPGLFEMADKGTIFLDEIGEMPLSLQPALLRVLQEGEITRIGSVEPIKIDVRVLAATNRDLFEMLKNKSFREDLYYRLNVISITIPPLRDRKDDIPQLVDIFVKNLNKKYKANKEVDSSFIFELMTRDWPGNIRELSNYVERQYILNESKVLTSTQDTHITNDSSNLLNSLDSFLPNGANCKMDDVIASIEASLIKTALSKCKNSSDAAKSLGISQPTFSRKYNKYKSMNLL